ncbi:hypothetical protein EDB80DRAFT_715697 [Ilyonectria destructans]|nr:hypothetical protein EDB80DRAFT_715697 [Ilyonectria destructans]
MSVALLFLVAFAPGLVPVSPFGATLTGPSERCRLCNSSRVDLPTGSPVILFPDAAGNKVLRPHGYGACTRNTFTLLTSSFRAAYTRSCRSHPRSDAVCLRNAT